MDQDKEIQRLFYGALGQPRETRLTWLAGACPDALLRAEVEALLDRDPGTASGSFLEPPTLPSLPSLEDIDGLQVEGFELQRVLGSGASATVFLARDTQLNREVALKIVTPPPMDAGAQLARFRQGAEIQAGLHHPCIVPIYQVGEAQGRHFIAMAFVPGATLADCIQAERRLCEGGPDRDHKLAVQMADMAEALDHAHRLRVIHRDVKPSNIIIDEEGQAHLIDFGIAKDDSQEDLTEEGSLLGTLRYMSPEQAEGATKVKLDARSDVFSLGVVLYEAVSLKQPFNGETVQEILAEVITKEATPLCRLRASIAGDLEIIVQKAMEKDPGHRYQSAMHLAADLRSFAAGDPILAQRPSLSRRLRRGLQKHRLPLAGALLLGLGLGIGTALREAPLLAGQASLKLSSGARGPVDFSILPVRYLEEGTLVPESTLDPIFELSAGPGGQIDVTLEAGAYRVQGRDEKGNYGDLTIVLGPGDEASYGLHLLPPAMELADMVRFPAGAHGGAFALDRLEVTNGRFREFLNSMTVEQGEGFKPRWWGVSGYDANWDALPVVGVTFDAAVRFAAWEGKRLPSASEWLFAATEGGQRTYPWGAERPPKIPVERDPGEGSFTPLTVGISPERMALVKQEYLQAVHAAVDPSVAGADWIDETPSGVRNLYGNVSEWTSSLPPRFGGMSAAVRIENRLVRGISWTTVAHQEQVPAAFKTESAERGLIGLGFRCARTRIE